MIKLWINWKKGDIQIKTHGGAWHLTGFCLQIPLRVSHLLSEPPAREVLTACPSPPGVLGLSGKGDLEGSCEGGSPSALRVQAWFWEGKRQNNASLTSDTLLMLSPGKERSSRLILIPVCHWKVTLMTGTVSQGLLSLSLLYTSAAFKRSCSVGEDWKERVSGPVHGVACGEPDPVKAECRGMYWGPVKNLNCYSLVICCS